MLMARVEVMARQQVTVALYEMRDVIPMVKNLLCLLNFLLHMDFCLCASERHVLYVHVAWIAWDNKYFLMHGMFYM